MSEVLSGCAVRAAVQMEKASMPKLTPAQLEALYDLAGHVGEFRRGYGKSAAALLRRGLAKRKFVSDEGDGLTAKFAITKAGIAALSNGDRNTP